MKEAIVCLYFLGTTAYISIPLPSITVKGFSNAQSAT